MRSVVIIAGGLLLLAGFALAGWRLGGGAASMVTAAKIFIPFWLAAALFNLWMGVSRAGYSVGEELPIFLVIFIVPAAVAGVIGWRYS
jgi:hypothetical protein